MTYTLAFLAGVCLGALPVVRRALETLRWSFALRTAERHGIQAEEMAERDLLTKLTTEKPKTRPVRLRRAK